MKEITLPDNSTYKIQNDRFRKSRGGEVTIYDIHCAKCDSLIFIYQKDGPGPLLRTYLDRIAWPPQLVSLVAFAVTQAEVKTLYCGKCKEAIAKPMTYEKENRLAYRMLRGKFSKTTRK